MVLLCGVQHLLNNLILYILARYEIIVIFNPICVVESAGNV